MSELETVLAKTGMSHAQINALIEEAVHEVARRERSDTMTQYRTPDGICLFVLEVIGAKPTLYQEDILRAFVEHRRVCVRGPHGLGKTTIAAWIVLWAMYVFPDDLKIITTAGGWRQLEKFLWPEVRKWARKIKWPAPKPHILNMSIKMLGKEAFAVASDEPSLIEGAHAKYLIYILDESKSISDDTFDAVEGAFSGAGDDTQSEAYCLAISTPGLPSGRFYDIHARKAGLRDWYPMHITLDQAIRAGRISQEWADARKEQWGEGSAVYQNRVLGNFSTTDPNALIPLAWVELAVERWYACKGVGVGSVSFGCDPARYGDDQTTIAKRVGNVIERITYHAQQSTMETSGRVASQISKETPCAIDTIGIGSGVFDRLRELGYTVRAVNVSAAATQPNGKPMTDKSGELTFLNLRAALWWMLRERLDPDGDDPIALPDDNQLIGDLTCPRYTYTSRGAIQVESKDDIRSRLHRSTDAADAVCLALYAPLAMQKSQSNAPRRVPFTGLYSSRDPERRFRQFHSDLNRRR